MSEPIPATPLERAGDWYRSLSLHPADRRATNRAINRFRALVARQEKRVEHQYYAYGRLLDGYGSSMDPHQCGDPNEPCITLHYEREAPPWTLTRIETKP